jgi:Family of unknown function (DUF6282)
MGSFPFLRRWFTKGCCRCGQCGKPGGHNRREFLKTAAAAAGAFELAGMAPLLEAARGQGRNSPPAPPAVNSIEGLTDTHLHSGPDAFGRAMDDEAALQLYKDKGMGAVVLKDHVVPTADRAWLARKHVAGLRVFGGVVLNSAVGGINPDAVSWMWRMQGGYGRFVWFPTFDSDNHVKHFKDAPQGIKVLDEGGKLLPAVYDVLKICAKQKLVVNTGHLSPAECLAVIAASRDAGADRIIVTHAQSEVPNMSMEDMKKAAAMGAKLELTAQGLLTGPQPHLEWMRPWRQIRVQETVDAIKTIGAANFVLGTDLGQTGDPKPADGLQLFVSELMAQGITMDQVKLMGREVPGALLMG